MAQTNDKEDASSIGSATQQAQPRPSTRAAPKTKAKDRRAAFIRQASLPLQHQPAAKTDGDNQDGHDDDPGSASQAPANDGHVSPGPPPLHTRWVHTLETAKGWKAFGARDSRRLEASWRAMQQSGCSSGGPSDPDQTERDADDDEQWSALDPDDDAPVWRVPVGQDKLYDADLRQLKASHDNGPLDDALHAPSLTPHASHPSPLPFRLAPQMAPVFWKDPKKLDVLRASWFYEANKLTPCVAALADELEAKFLEIQPWLSSYTDELKSSLSLGAEAEAKLKCPLKSIKNAYVIFQGPRLARLYTEDFTARISKQFFTAWSGEHGGGQLLVRGYQTLVQLQEAKKGGRGSGSGNGASSSKKSRRAPSTKRAAKRRSLATVSSAHHTEAETEVDDAKKDDVAKDLQDALQENQEVLKSSTTAAADDAAEQQATTEGQAGAEQADAADGNPNASKPPARSDSGVTVSTGTSIDTAQATPSVDVSTTHANATTDSAKSGAGARLRSLAMAASNRSSAAASRNDLLRSVASRFGAWAGGSGEAGGAEGLTTKQQQEIANSFKEAQRRAQDLPASEYETTDDEHHHNDGDGEHDDDGDDDGHEDDDEDRPLSDDPEAFDDAEEQREEAEEEAHPPELLLAVHGIGQRLAGDWKSFDFVVAINAFRELVQQRIDTVKAPSDIGGGGLKALANGRRLQFLPVMWRAGFHVGEADKQAADAALDEEDEMFDNGLELDMDHIFGNEGIPIVRTMTREVLMDIPMYLSHHRQHIIDSVRREANRQYRVFVKRNPRFEERGGKVHIIAHSLGSAIATEILSMQPTKVPLVKDLGPSEAQKVGHSRLIFNVEKFFAVGSPVGIWFVLNRSQLVARRGRECRSSSDEAESGVPNRAVSLDEEGRYGCMSVSGFYNIANQFDPVGTRCTPCVDVKYSKLVKPVALSKATRAVLRADPKAIPPEAATSTTTTTKKDGRREGDDAAAATEDKAAKANATSGATATFFSSWGRKAGGAAAALSSSSSAGKGAQETKPAASSDKAEDDSTGAAAAAKDEDGPSAASGWLDAASKAIKRRSMGSASGHGDQDGDASDGDGDDRADAVAATTHADEDGDDVRSRIRARAKKEEEKQRRKAEEEERAAKEEMSEARRQRAEARLRALNPMQRVDFYMPLEGYSLLSTINQYAELMTAHMSYWSRADLADFLVAQLLSDDERLAKSLEFKAVEGWE
ncbi:uncharacterized protein PFL1_04612 [Pseudozyma flocculosa PF-1]|uniref:DDHD domain-containing protein n=2 Tax=Pseudozyma flocculosa TaxID=84751 RepID=A0A5C3F9A3_9BASI|nr:uncharacterized protein PFL1_04612 [Pseudozyma flocculosa PF-1]EPQ27868.1 hypothetical protein PFL1_04612 [Pseudozyma flocculosa PF-1]SPO41002.1 uncharacterized protein PSFLO_06484 [Pseudozyma flocculosa]